jgi:hypothetical protein
LAFFSAGKNWHYVFSKNQGSYKFLAFTKIYFETKMAFFP